MLPRILLLLAAWPVWAEPSRPVRQGADAPVARDGGRAQGSDLAALAVRDARLSFTLDSARRAREALESGTLEAEARAVALLALGCGRSPADLARLELSLAVGTSTEQRAALLALGELGPDGWPSLEHFLAGERKGLEGTLCLALALSARAGSAPAAERLEGLAQGEDPFSRRARAARAWSSGAGADELAETLRLYYELRWRAARAYGFLDGQRGQQAYAAELFRDDEFLDRVVLSAAAELAPEQLRLHFMEMLRSGDDPAALRLAARVQPAVLAQAFTAGLWQPTPEDWDAVLSELEDQHAEKGAEDLLEVAFQQEELEPRAGLLLFRGGADLPWSWVEERLESGTPAFRVALLEACGERGDPRRIPELTRFQDLADGLGVAAETLVALARLGHAPAKTTLGELLSGAPSPEREAAIRALTQALRDRTLRSLAERARQANGLSLEQRFALDIALARIGALPDRSELRRALALPLKPAQRLACLRALAFEPEPADLDALAAVFPIEDDLEANVELARVLLAQRHPATGGLLRAALWSRAWNRSVLAGGLIAQISGLRSLIDELELAPRRAGEGDLRRVGFAIGEWGGLGAVEELARSRQEGDPALQGALLGALAARSTEPVPTGVLKGGAPLGLSLEDEEGPVKTGAKPAGPAKKGKKKGGARKPF